MKSPANRVLLPLWEKVACEAGRMRGRTALSPATLAANRKGLEDPSSVGYADTFSHKGRRTR